MGQNLITVGLGELHFSRKPESVLVCYGLGSCIGVCMFDSVTRMGAMAHIVLPDSNMARAKDAPAKFADTCIPAMLDLMEKNGAQRANLIVKLAGGAQVLSVPGMANRLDIGKRNIEAVKKALELAHLRPTSVDVGGNFGRTMQFFIPDGKITIRAVGQSERIL